MGRFELTVDDFVANGCPANLAAELNSQIVFREQPKLVCHDDWRTVIERNKTKPQRAVSAAWRISHGAIVMQYPG